MSRPRKSLERLSVYQKRHQPGIWVSACQRAITNCVQGNAHQDNPKSNFFREQKCHADGHAIDVEDFFPLSCIPDKYLLLCSFVDPNESIKGQIGIINVAAPGLPGLLKRAPRRTPRLRSGVGKRASRSFFDNRSLFRADRLTGNRLQSNQF